MAEDLAFQALIDRLRRGEPDAARQIFHQFGQRLIALARSRLHGQIRHKVDPEDIMQSVFKSFFRRQADAPFELDNQDSLWSLLTKLTLRKCGHKIEHFRAQCRDVQREVAPRPLPEDSYSSWEAMAREPTPVEAALLNEALAALLRDLSERDRRIVELSLRGYTVAEVSVQVACAERTVQRLLARIKQRLERLGADDAASP
jgi:RNA polymerase sigma-70 factor, ECF subfamily